MHDAPTRWPRRPARAVKNENAFALLWSPSQVTEPAEMQRILVVLGADELQDFFLRHQRGAHGPVPGLRVGVFVIDGDFHLQMSAIRPLEAFHHVELVAM